MSLNPHAKPLETRACADLAPSPLAPDENYEFIAMTRSSLRFNSPSINEGLEP